MGIGKFLRKTGENMLSITWGAVFGLSIASTATGATFLAIVGFANGVFSIEFAALLWLLLQVSFLALVSILIFTGLIKLVCFSLGNFFIWISRIFFKEEDDSILKLTTIDDISTHVIQDPFIGFSHSAGFSIQNNSPFEISECIATLESVETVLINNEALVYKNVDFGNIGIHSQRKLRWVGKDFDDKECKQTLPGMSKEALLQVANLIDPVKVIKDGGENRTEYYGMRFEFSFCGANIINYHVPGLYKVKIRVMVNK